MSDKIKIENLYRLTTKSLRPLFTQAKETKRILSGKEYDTSLECNVSFSRSSFNKEYKFFLKVFYRLHSLEECTEESLRLEWTTPEGEDRERIVKLETKESNLLKGEKVYYFSNNGRLFRTLYSDGWGVFFREEIEGKTIYKAQTLSKNLREFFAQLKADEFLSGIEGSGRHLLYKGRYTPFAKKALRKREYLNQHPLSPDMEIGYFLKGTKRRSSKGVKRPSLRGKKFNV